MATNPSTPEQRKVVSVEILHLDELGYGPQGKHTRREWRKECLDNLLAGTAQFLAWQESWIDQINDSIPPVSFDCRLINSDTSNNNSLDRFPSTYQQHPYDLDFVGHTFEGFNVFNSVDFLQNVLFNGAEFCLIVCFYNVKFRKVADFSNAIFTGGALISDSLFGSITYFNFSKFKNPCIFINVIFIEDALFGNATFQQDLAFGESAFQKKAQFGRCLFENGCSFITSNFEDAAIFEGAIFKNVGHFEKAKFSKITLSYRGCNIGDTRLEFSDERFFPKHENSEESIKNISFLKRLSEEHGQTEQALNFNAMELKAKAASDDASWNFKIVTFLYRYLSNFGRSFARPLSAFAVLFGISYIGALIFAGNSAPIVCKEQMLQYKGDIRSGSPVSCLSYVRTGDDFHLSGYRAAFEYAAYRSSGILDFSDNDKQTSAINMRVFDQYIEPGWVRFWGVLKAIASTALLFLAALGLRNKYRIK